MIKSWQVALGIGIALLFFVDIEDSHSRDYFDVIMTEYQDAIYS